MDTTEKVLQVWDRQEIEQLLYRLVRSLDRMDIELLKSCYWPEAIEELEDTITGMFQYNGKAWDFAPTVMEVFSNLNRTQHRLSSILTQLDGDKATAETYITAYHQFTDEKGEEKDQFVGARQLYKFEKRNDEWRILHRFSIWEWNQNIDNTALWVDPKNVNEKYLPKRDKSDISYQFIKN